MALTGLHVLHLYRDIAYAVSDLSNKQHCFACTMVPFLGYEGGEKEYS